MANASAQTAQTPQVDLLSEEQFDTLAKAYFTFQEGKPSEINI